MKTDKKKTANNEMSLDELDKVVGGTSLIGDGKNDYMAGGDGADSIQGRGGDDVLKGGGGNDVLVGGTGNDKLYGNTGDDTLAGGAGNDTLYGGTGDDVLDGGWGDRADDVTHGGAGDDAYVWGVSGDGNDTFHGGEGEDELRLDLDNVNAGTIQEAYENGDWTIEVKDADGNEFAITDDMWDENGNLNLPDGTTGVITGSDGETITFDGVERITTFQVSSDAVKGTGGNDNLTGWVGEQVLKGGGGDDIIHGGEGDGSDDSAYGGSGDDTYVWGLTGDGNDTFHGGAGNDAIELDLSTVEEDTIKEAFENGTWELKDSDGYSIGITDDMWDEDGNLNLPAGFAGSIVGPAPEYSTITFDGVETIAGLG